MDEKITVNSNGTIDATNNGGIDMRDVLNKIPITKFSRRNAWLGIAGLLKAAGALFEDFLAWCKGDPETFKDEEDCRNAWSINPKETMGEAKRRLLAIAGIKHRSKKKPIAETSADIPEQTPITETSTDAKVDLIEQTPTVDISIDIPKQTQIAETSDSSVEPSSDIPVTDALVDVDSTEQALETDTPVETSIEQTPIVDTSVDTQAEQALMADTSADELIQPPTADNPVKQMPMDGAPTDVLKPTPKTNITVNDLAQMLRTNITVNDSGLLPQTSPSLPPMERDKAIVDARTIVKTIHPNRSFLFSYGPKEKINSNTRYLKNTEEELTDMFVAFLEHYDEWKDGVFWQLNEATLSEKRTVRADGITSFTWGLLESDDLPIAKQYALLKSISLPLFAAIHSGGKSIHAFIHIGAQNAEEYKIRIAKVYQYAEQNGLPVDQACKSLGRWSRFPLATRGSGYQYPVIVNQEYLTYEKWEEQIFQATPAPVLPTGQITGNAGPQGAPKTSVPIPPAGDENKASGRPMLRYHHVEKCIADPKHCGEVRYNELNGEFDISGFSWLKKNPGEDRLDVLADELQAFLHLRYSYVSHELVVRHLQKIGRDHSYNPIKERLEKEVWDGRDRFNQLCDTLTPMDDFSRLLVRKWLIQCIAMQYNDWGKIGADGVLTLQGPEGIGKTSFFRSLVPEIEWFQEGISIDTESKDSIRKAISKWISEIGECDHTTKKQQANLKAFITQNADRYRREYERTFVEVPRRTSFCATVNNDAFLYEGDNRRWWVIKVTGVDLEGLNALKPEVWQIWAQAKQEWDKNHKAFRLTSEERAELCKRNRDFQVKLTYQDILEEYFDWDVDPVRWREMEPKELRRTFEIKPSEAQRFGAAITRLVKNHGLETRILHGYRLVKLPPER